MSNPILDANEKYPLPEPDDPEYGRKLGLASARRSAYVTAVLEMAQRIKVVHEHYGPVAPKEGDFNAGAHDAIGRVLDLFRYVDG